MPQIVLDISDVGADPEGLAMVAAQAVERVSGTPVSWSVVASPATDPPLVAATKQRIAATDERIRA